MSLIKISSHLWCHEDHTEYWKKALKEERDRFERALIWGNIKNDKQTNSITG